MNEEINDLVKQEIAEIKKEEAKPVERKGIGNLDVNDIELTIDRSKSFEQQAEDIVGAMATAEAVKDKQTAKDLAEKKAEELKAKASHKLKAAQTEDIKAETAKQEANRSKNEAVLQTFGINKHLPDWLLKIMVVLFSPIFIVLTIIIGVPCGVVKVLIDNIDNILVRYDTAKDTNKPKIKVTVWIILVLAILAAIGFIVLKCTGKI